MLKQTQRKKYKNKNKLNNCEYCDECQYVGEGDFACMRYENPVIIKEDWSPTKYYNNCKMCKEYNLKIKEE